MFFNALLFGIFWNRMVPIEQNKYNVDRKGVVRKEEQGLVENSL